MELGSLSPTEIAAEILGVVVYERGCTLLFGCCTLNGTEEMEKEEERVDFGERKEMGFGLVEDLYSFGRVKMAAVVAAIVEVLKKLWLSLGDFCGLFRLFLGYGRNKL